MWSPPLPSGRMITGALVLMVSLLVVLTPAVGRWWRAPRTPTPVAASQPTPPPQPPAMLPTSVTASQTVALAAAAPAYREAIVGAPATLNPLLAASEAELAAARLLFAGLTQADGRGGVEPQLAERWAVGEGDRAYTFHLRPGATWHDGQPVTAQDVLYTVRLMQDANFPGSRRQASLWRSVRLDVLDAATVRFTLSEPYAPFLSMTTFPLLPAHRLHGVFPGDLPRHEFSQQPVGAGPYRMAGPMQADRLMLERYDQYFGPRPKIERITLHFYADLDQALAALHGGQVDALAGVPASYLGQFRDAADYQVHTAPINGYSALFLNLRRPLFQQREVRQAVALALDRKALIDGALDGDGQVQTGPIVTSSWAYQAPPGGGTIHEARARLEQAGWFDSDGDGLREREGRPLAFTLLTNDSIERTRVAAVIAHQLSDAGMQVTVQTLPMADLLARHLSARDFDALLFGWTAIGDDPDPYSLWHSSQVEQGVNFAGWSMTRADELLEQGRIVLDRERRREYYAEFQRLFLEETPSIVLYGPSLHMVATTRLHNVDLGPLNRPADRYRTIARWVLEPAGAVG